MKRAFLVVSVYLIPILTEVVLESLRYSYAPAQFNGTHLAVEEMVLMFFYACAAIITGTAAAVLYTTTQSTDQFKKIFGITSFAISIITVVIYLIAFAPTIVMTISYIR